EANRYASEIALTPGSVEAIASMLESSLLDDASDHLADLVQSNAWFSFNSLGSSSYQSLSAVEQQIVAAAFDYYQGACSGSTVCFSCPPLDCEDEVAGVCGDGVVDGDEECDDGNASNTDACTDACMHAVCGDGYIWSGIEECDDGNTQGGDECDASCQSEARHVFVTDETYNGALGGLAGADQKCQASASAANLPGSYYAWVSASDGSPSSRFS
ncbi:MAG: DUF4215 domain-containing protein, partial [Myxococcales bacterium]|nr:DUF4215 domain-containing protein [Myxococcales bacterium]